MKSLASFSVGFVLLVVSVSVGAAPIYTWQDEKGQTYFSDQPPEGIPGAEQTAVQTETKASDAPYVEHPYSIQKQVDLLQAQKEKRQKMILDERAARQSMEMASRQTNTNVMPPLDGGIPPIVPLYRHDPLYYRTPRYGYRHPVYRHRPGHGGSSLRYVHQGDHHRLNLNLGFYNRLSPSLYNRLHYQKFR